jgi:hypothetical protein
VKTIAKYGHGHPHFEIVDGALSFRGVVGVSGCAADRTRAMRDKLRDKEQELTRIFLAEMKRLADARGVPFVVILLHSSPPYAVARQLVESRIPVLDLADLGLKGFRFDPHPNPDDHRRIADAILASFIPSMLARDPKHPGLEQ